MASTLARPAVSSVAQTRPPAVASAYGGNWKPPIVDVVSVEASIRVTVPEPLLATQAALESRAIELGCRPTATASRVCPLAESTTATWFAGTLTGA